MVHYQVKVEYAPQKFVKFYLDVDITDDGRVGYSYSRLVKEICSHCTSVAHLSINTMRIRYKDEEGDFINLVDDGDDNLNLKEMFLHAKTFEDRSYRQVTLTVGEIDSPVVNTENKKKRSFEKSTTPAARSLSSCFSSNAANTNTPSVHTDIPKKMSTSPLEKYVIVAEQEVAIQQAKVTRLREEKDDLLSKLEIAKCSASIIPGSVCGRCHLQVGHTQKKCDLNPCKSVFECGQEKRHPGEVNTKRIQQLLQKEEHHLQELEYELKNRKKTIEQVEMSKTKRIESLLLENRDNYTQRGMLDWSLLRQHVALVERYAKKHLDGKIPGKDVIPAILKRGYKGQEKSLGRVRTKGNPFASVLKSHGVEFPRPPASTDSQQAKDFELAVSMQKDEIEEANAVDALLSLKSTTK